MLDINFMINWRDKVLFYTKSNGGKITRRSLEPMLMNGCETYDDSLERFKSILDENLLERIEDEEYSFGLTEIGSQKIAPFYKSAISVMELVRIRLKELVKSRTSIELKGGLTGIYFTYTGLSMFRFHPDMSDDGVFLFVRLPNLIGNAIGNKSNELYVSEEILRKTEFLEMVVNAHLEMIDKLHDQEV